ncbi:hypothetical protein [Malacoplasma iowae]|uniref:Uncharacterized protein n=1 Tax=Malacoplasma iowae DK-CPA TaxID=1394179 RepID=A0A084U3C8_MALIO|nr:hypothetical protein [Malacoplasma iowae]KFB07464.1 hypothetical protein P271_301 [Malacoplasma iowae DK-CPA]WPL36627.1 hypothetical protein QX179_04355 [Malacoplasma iowae]WPL37850.1 hypothetical protein QX182_05100 [Malacoplasma iowae]WPL41243.1 hypothetical protein QX184_01415 [Malacoplasma iowae]
MKLKINKNNSFLFKNIEELNNVNFLDDDQEQQASDFDDQDLSDGVSEKLLDYYHEREFHDYYDQQSSHFSIKEYLFNLKSTKNSLWFLFVYLLVFFIINYLISNYILYVTIFNQSVSINNNFLIWSNYVTRIFMIVFFVISFVLTLFSNIGFLISNKNFNDRLIRNSIIQFIYILIILFECLSFLHFDLFSNKTLEQIGYFFSFVSWNDNLLYVNIFLLPILIYLFNNQENTNKKTKDIKNNNLVYFLCIVSIIAILFIIISNNVYDNISLDAKDNYSIFTNVIVLVLSLITIIIGINSKSMALIVAKKFSEKNYKLAYHCFCMFFFFIRILSIITLLLSITNLATTLWNYLNFQNNLNSGISTSSLNYSGIVLINFAKVSNIDFTNSSLGGNLTNYQVSFGYSISSFTFVLFVFLFIPLSLFLYLYDIHFLKNKNIYNQDQMNNQYNNKTIISNNNMGNVVMSQNQSYIEDIKAAFELLEKNIITKEEYAEIKRKIIEKI